MIGTGGPFWDLVSQGCSENDEYDEHFGCGFKSWNGSNKLEEHIFFIPRQKSDTFVSDVVGGQKVDQGFSRHDMFEVATQIKGGEYI